MSFQRRNSNIIPVVFIALGVGLLTIATIMLALPKQTEQLAGGAMAFSSVFVVTNSLRLRRVKI